MNTNTIPTKQLKALTTQLFSTNSLPNLDHLTRQQWLAIQDAINATLMQLLSAQTQEQRMLLTANLLEKIRNEISQTSPDACPPPFSQSNTKDLNDSILATINHELPALTKAFIIQQTVATVGFDWPDVLGALDKVSEEVDELKQELTATQISTHKTADELGDLYFALTNVSRHLNLEPESVINKASAKFVTRFRFVEQQAYAHHKKLQDCSLSELESWWQQAKKSGL